MVREDGGRKKRKQMKHKMILGTVMALLLGTGCASQGTASVQTAAPAAASSSADASASSQSKALVVYYSATGTTKSVGDMIAEAVNADTFAAEAKETYTAEDLTWSNENSRVAMEHNDTAKQNSVELVSTSVTDWASYDTVFIGYPIWWGDAAWPINGFVTANDFTNKKVIPFCTSASSELGDSGTGLAEKANGGNWLEGKRFSGSSTEAEIAQWAETCMK
jgi:flavodoxin